ncbi:MULTISPECIES: OTU domain-containing protein [unclassified Wolbachia]|uniref:hypothetical protein n=1 Tax=unclassified Wolbachia TaxID=2640676 RepID=UPI0021F82FF5|nr:MULTISPECIES: hypothetical protein [unclassified Wolbachia]
MLAVGKGSGVSREPISVFCQIKKAKGEKRKELEELLSKLKKEFPGNYKIGAAVGAGDCFFDSVAQGLNELKSNGLITSSEEFNVKSLRKSCKQYAKQSKSSSWLNKALKKEDDNIIRYVSRIEFTVKDVKDLSLNSLMRKLELEDAVCGRNEIEGKIICEKYNVKIKVIELHEKSVDGLHITTDEVGTGDNVVYIVNYSNHFVPLLSNIEKDIEDDMPVSREKIYGVSSNTSEKPKAEKKDLNEILARCEELICDKCDKGEDIFELLDPLVSDSLCQIRPLFILSMLPKFCKEGKLSRDEVKNLTKKEKDLFLPVILLSLLKYRKKDKLGIAVLEESIDNFGGVSLGKDKEEELIAKMKSEINLHSIEYIKNIANERVQKILGTCKGVLLYSKHNITLKVLPCYISVYAVISCMEQKGLPIIISLVRINRVNDQLSIDSKDVLFYKFQAENKKTFYYKKEEDVDENEKVQPTLAFFCFSLINGECSKEYKEYADGTQVPSKKFLTEDCDIRNILMLHPAGHIQLPLCTKLPEEDKPSKDEEKLRKYVESLYEKCPDGSVELQDPLVDDFHSIDKDFLGYNNMHVNFARRFGIKDTRYSHHVKVGNLAKVTRRSENALFAIHHICLSNYSREREYQKSLAPDAKVNMEEDIKVDKATEKAKEVLRQLHADTGAGPSTKVDETETSKAQRGLTNLRMNLL